MVSPSCFVVSFEFLLVNEAEGVLVPQFKNNTRLINPKTWYTYLFIALFLCTELFSSYITKMLLNKIVLNAYKNYKAFNKNEQHNMIILRYFNRDF